MKKRPIAIAMFIAGGVLAVLVCADLLHGIMPKRRPTPLTPAEMRAMVPADMLDPTSAAFQFTGPALTAFRKQPPLQVGQPGPRVQTTDYRGNSKVSVPSRQAIPTVCMVSCGCQRCAAVLAALHTLEQDYPGRFQVVGIIDTHSNYIWGHYASSYALWNVQLIHDPKGDFWGRMRPPGDHPERLPLVWVSDGKGILRYVRQPDENGAWKAGLRAALHLPPRAG
jgi:hypothetical protein